MKCDPIQILHNTFGFKLVSTKIGQDLIQLSAKEAFTFVNTVNGLSGNSFYFDSSNNDFRPIILSDPASRGVLDYSTNNAPIFQCDKYLIPFKYNKTMETKNRIKIEVLDRLRQMDIDPKSCVVLLIAPGDTGAGEAFWEYVAGQLYARDGFLVENQLKYSGVEGIPDLGAYFYPELLDLLRELDFLGQGGFICDLVALRVFGKIKANSLPSPPVREKTYVLGEVKVVFSGQKKYTEQIYKYQASGKFDRIIQITPDYPRIDPSYDYLALDPSSVASIQWSPTRPTRSTPIEWQAKKQVEFQSEIIHNIKNALLKNLTLPELIELHNLHYQDLRFTITQLFDSLTQLKLTTIGEYVSKFLN